MVDRPLEPDHLEIRRIRSQIETAAGISHILWLNSPVFRALPDVSELGRVPLRARCPPCRQWEETGASVRTRAIAGQLRVTTGRAPVPVEGSRPPAHNRHDVPRPAPALNSAG